MYSIVKTKDFERSYKKLRSSKNFESLSKEIEKVVDKLQQKIALEPKYRDHKLQGDFTGYRECHLRPDLLLIYKIHEDVLILQLIDVGSHSYLFK